ncbi:IgGFc-binding protein [Holothuria leucospilota]|uniref:IgGFc-binding protein n=1 Tax=Holothuria leucospilota TaxID=206669 RepID=A0A9Q1CMC8_HOLLE|nr:IgGFc-binding protein [Holothuria leucospilota]
MASRNVLLFVIMTGTCIKMTESMGLCEFEGKFPCADESECPKYICIGVRRGNPAKDNENETSTPQHISTHTTTIDLTTNVKLSTNRNTTVQLDGYSTADPLPTNPVCPLNMVYTNCSCQGTCEDPSGCHNNCSESKMCVCPNGFLMRGDDCIPEMMCGCFIDGYGVLRKDGFYVNSTCSERCTCFEDILSCEEDFKCDSNAICERRDGVRDCYCNTGFAGDGQICISTSTFSDCYEIFSAGITSDGVYTVTPNGWTGAPFEVYCNMSHGGGWTVSSSMSNYGRDNFFKESEIGRPFPIFTFLS